MKVFKLTVISMVLISAILIGACGNSASSNQSGVAANIGVEVTTNVNETAVAETKLETIYIQAETTTQVVAQTKEQVKETQIENADKKTNSNDLNEENEMPIGDILVAYFSATGTTKRVAEKIAELTGADIYEIVPANPYSSADLNWNDRNSRSTKEMDDPNVRPEIGSIDISLDRYKTIYLGFPIWWGTAPKIMETFVEKYNFDGKKVIPFCTSGSSGIGDCGSKLGALAGSGNFAVGERFSASADEGSIQSFINNNK